MPRIKLPRELRGTQFSRVTTLDLNPFDVDLLLQRFACKLALLAY